MAAATSLVDPVSGMKTTGSPKTPRRAAPSRNAVCRSAGSSDIRLELETQIRSGSGVRQRADGHVIGAGLRHFGDPAERHAAGDLALRPARDSPHRILDLIVRQIVEQDDVSTS